MFTPLVSDVGCYIEIGGSMVWKVITGRGVLTETFAGAGVLVFVMANSNIRGRPGYRDVHSRDAYGTVCHFKLMANM